MHENGRLTWREVIDQYHAGLIHKLSSLIDSEVKEAVSRAMLAERAETRVQMARARDETRNAQAEAVNQALRRLRQAQGEEQVLAVLQEQTRPYADPSLLFVFESNRAEPLDKSVNGAAELGFDISAAPAVVTAIETRDPVVAIASDTEISPRLASLFGDSPDGKVYLFPLVRRHSVIAMLIARALGGSAPLEALCEAAGMRLEALAPSRPQPMGIEYPAPAGAAREIRSWNELTPEDQKLHLQAQRVARVRVAEMRVHNEEALRRGVSTANIYGELSSRIDAARQQFLREFLSKSPTMVDYLHVEILRSLANEDDRLLGENYPGPMV